MSSDPSSCTNHPVDGADTGSKHTEIEDGAALCLSGGGYRAMLFHVGALWRLNDCGYLPKLKRISSVSGGSITSAVLGMNWSRFIFDAAGKAEKHTFIKCLVEPVRGLADKSLDVRSILTGLFLPGNVSEKLAAAYDRYLFHGKTLQALPDDPPRFVINATNVQSGALWRFMKPYMRDWRVGEVKKPEIKLAEAVAASSAFPPVLSPAKLNLKSSRFTPNSGADLQREPFTTEAIVTDGGVYDNLGLETAWKRYGTILVSDAGGKMKPEEKPKRDWIRHSVRVLELIDNQVRSLRKRQLIGSFVEGARQGAYWGMRTDIGNYGLSNALLCPFEKTLKLAEFPTRLKKVDPETQEKLINWGYAVCDAAMRKHVQVNMEPPDQFPYPAAGV